MSIANSDSATRRAMQWLGLSLTFGMIALATLLALFFWYLQQTALEQQRQTLSRDAELIQQSLRLRWREHQDELVLAAQAWGRRAQLDQALRSRIEQFLQSVPDAVYVAALDAERKILWRLTGRGIIDASNRRPGQFVEDSGGYSAFSSARDAARPVFSPPFLWENNEIAIELHAPVNEQGRFAGTLAVGYSLNRTLGVALHGELANNYQITISDAGGNELLSNAAGRVHEARLSYELPLNTPGHGMRLRVYAFALQPKAIEHLLLIAVAGLSIGSVAGLLMLWRQGRRRVAAESERDRLFNLSPDIICTMDAAGRFGRVNPAFITMLGGQAASRPIIDCMHEDDRARAYDALKQGERSALTCSFEGRFLTREGSMRWLRWSLRSDPAQANTTLYAVAHDITMRHDAEQALAAEFSFRQAMEDSVLTGMRAFDLLGRITYVNRAFCAMTGFEQSELVGATPPYPYWPDEEYLSHWSHFRTTMAGDAPPGGFEVLIRRRDESRFHARMYVSALIDHTGTQTGWMTSMTDITEPKRIRQALAAAHERFATVLDELDAAICVRDPQAQPNTAPLFANRRFLELFGERGDALIPIRDAQRMRRSEAPQLVHDAANARWFEMHARQFTWVDGRPVELFVASDVSQRQQAEQHQRDQERKLQGTARLVTMGEMASSLAHEINQPLTAISNYCMGLSARIRTQIDAGSELDTSQILDALGKASRQADRAAQVIRRIREFVKRSDPEQQACDIGQITADALGLAQIDADRHGVEIDSRVARDLPVVMADPILLEQVLLNLLRNAVEATRERGTLNPSDHQPRVELSVIAEPEMIRFSIRDHGAGLQGGASDRLYEPFFTTKGEGMGIGLNICRSIIESHQGRLWHENNRDHGLTFRFTLPLPKATAIERAA